jgi:hypothetical protein
MDDPMKFEYGMGRTRHPILCRWWLKTRPIRVPEYRSDDKVLEFYVPWWAWPLELLHRIIFGSSRIYPR